MPAVSFPLARHVSMEEFGMWGCHPLMLEPQEIWETERSIRAEVGWGMASHRFIHQ